MVERRHDIADSLFLRGRDVGRRQVEEGVRALMHHGGLLDTSQDRGNHQLSGGRGGGTRGLMVLGQRARGRGERRNADLSRDDGVRDRGKRHMIDRNRHACRRNREANPRGFVASEQSEYAIFHGHDRSPLLHPAFAR
jgi:hypothetical protein